MLHVKADHSLEIFNTKQADNTNSSRIVSIKSRTESVQQRQLNELHNQIQKNLQPLVERVSNNNMIIGAIVDTLMIACIIFLVIAAIFFLKLLFDCAGLLIIMILLLAILSLIPACFPSFGP